MIRLQMAQEESYYILGGTSDPQDQLGYDIAPPDVASCIKRSKKPRLPGVPRELYNKGVVQRRLYEKMPGSPIDPGTWMEPPDPIQVFRMEPSKGKAVDTSMPGPGPGPGPLAPRSQDGGEDIAEVSEESSWGDEYMSAPASVSDDAVRETSDESEGQWVASGWSQQFVASGWSRQWVTVDSSNYWATSGWFQQWVTVGWSKY
ncbi:hypothetical protein QBC39DRAFT_413646 [Podospora conica]|nr:hypothetical protein QBC39DRAFT_413646 [Schizothecium conicum]